MPATPCIAVSVASGQEFSSKIPNRSVAKIDLGKRHIGKFTQDEEARKLTGMEIITPPFAPEDQTHHGNYTFPSEVQFVAIPRSGECECAPDS
jgi:hypothetical protein